MSGNPYYNPESWDLELLATHDFSSGSYEFDYRCIWRHLETKRLYTARDSGCSCPSPFEDFNNISQLEDFSLNYLIDEARTASREDEEPKAVGDWIQELREIAKLQRSWSKKRNE